MNREDMIEEASNRIEAERHGRIEAARRALSAAGAAECVDCHRPIPEARRKAAPFARRCAGCQAEQEADRR